MPPSLSQSIIIDSDSNFNAQLELSKLKSELFKDENTDEESNALSSTNTPTKSSPQSFKQAYKKRRVRAINTWALARKPISSKPLVNSKGRQYWYYRQCGYHKYTLSSI